MTPIAIASLVPDHVLSVYSGKPGCACGCRGKHSYNPEHRVEAAREQGYALSNSEINAVQVARVLKIVQAAPKVVIDEDLQGRPGRVLSLETDSRLYIVYLREGVSVEQPIAAKAA